MIKILGISEGSHDAAWTIIENGKISSAHHSERFVREKIINGLSLTVYQAIVMLS